MASSGNFCTLNPLSTKGPTLSQGNCRADSTFYWATYYGTVALPTSGKWYAECRTPNISGPDASFPMGIQDAQLLTYLGDKTSNGNPQYIGMATSTAGEGYSIYTHANGTYSKKYHNNSSSDTSLASASNGDIYQIAVDLDNNKLWFGKNNTWDQSNPSGNGTATYTITNKSYVMGGSASSSEYHIWNFGQDSTFGGGVSAGGNADGNGFGDFAYAPPTGFVAVCSANLPISDDIDPAQTDDDYVGGKQFNVLTYTGNGSTQSISNLGFKPDLVWIKSRSNSNSNELYDSSRGATKRLRSDTNDGEDTRSSELTGFTSDGFSLGSSTYGGTNYNSYTYVAWCWRCAGGVTSSNTNGDITTTVQANQDAGFSIFTYTGNGGGAGTTMGHGLSQAPDIWFLKQTSNNGESSQKDWRVMLNTGAGGAFRSLNNGSQTLKLNSNSSKSGLYRTEGNFEPTSTVVQAPNNGNANAFFVVSGNTYVSYCWHSVEGYSKFGSYEGNGNADGPFIYTGFRPRLVFVKALDATENWQVRDTARSTYNADSQVRIYWNSSSAEGSASTASPIDFLANGFKVRGSNTEINGDTMVYGAWGDVPFKYGNTFG